MTRTPWPSTKNPPKLTENRCPHAPSVYTSHGIGALGNMPNMITEGQTRAVPGSLRIAAVSASTRLPSSPSTMR